jgi:hypothetical protein
MQGLKRGLMLVMLPIALLSLWQGAAWAQVSTTAIQDVVYRADGTQAGGTVLVSWPQFTTSTGNEVAAGTTSVTIGPAGALALALTPNAGATPTGSYYTAVFHLDDGTTSTEYWVVPVSTTPVTLAAIENQVLPASTAIQTASKSYVDAAIANAQLGGTGTGGTTQYVPISGGTMTGPLVLPADPVTPNQAADKHYIDTNVTALTSGLGQKVSLVPTLTQTIAQPAGTQLQVNVLNGEMYASQFQTGDGNDGIENALASQQCASDCYLKVDPNYGGEPMFSFDVPQTGHVVDLRGGSDAETFFDPTTATSWLSTSEILSQISTRTDANSPNVGGNSTGTTHLTLELSNAALTGGSNQLPGNVENPPYGKTTYGVISDTGNYSTQGQHVQSQHTINCYGVGDCLAGSQFITSEGGYRDIADEGTHPFDLQVSEDGNAFQGTCSSGCTTGSTSVRVNTTVDGNSEGDGRFLIDKNPADEITMGAIVSESGSVLDLANFSGTNFPTSVFLQTAAAATSQAKNIAPGTVTLPIVTSGVPAGFATTTTALTAQSGVACVADTNDLRFPNFETASYTVVDASHISLTLNKVHASGAVIAVGGLCGYGLEQTVDTVNGIRQVFPVVGSASATGLYYAGASTAVIGDGGLASTSGYQNVTMQIASVARQTNVVTVTFTSNMPVDLNGVTMTVSGVADASYNGSFAVTTTGGNTLTYADNGQNGTSSGGTVSLLTGGYVLYPMAEVLSVYDTASRQVDGLLTLAPNTVAWAQGDAVEEPHYPQQLTSADTELVTQYVPRPIQFNSAGKTYQGEVGPGMRGWEVTNAVPPSNYLGAGGTREPPDDAYVASGVWNNDFEVDAGALALIRAHCNWHGCNRWDSGYSLFALDSVTGEDFLFYNPATYTATWILHNTDFSFSPSGFNAGTVNAGTLNASTLNAGTLNASTISGNGGKILLGSEGPEYSDFTLNGANVDGARIGFVGGGGGDNNLYLDVPANGGFVFRVNNAHVVALTGNNDGTVQSGVVQAQQVMGSGSQPGVTVGSAAGSGASESLSGTTLSGVLTVTTGTSPAAGGTLATVNWSLPSATPPEGCSLMPRNASAAAMTATVFTGAPTTSGWTVNAGATALAASTAYEWSYQCM